MDINERTYMEVECHSAESLQIVWMHEFSSKLNRLISGHTFTFVSNAGLPLHMCTSYGIRLFPSGTSTQACAYNV